MLHGKLQRLSCCANHLEVHWWLHDTGLEASAVQDVCVGHLQEVDGCDCHCIDAAHCSWCPKMRSWSQLAWDVAGHFVDHKDQIHIGRHAQAPKAHRSPHPLVLHKWACPCTKCSKAHLAMDSPPKTCVHGPSASAPFAQSIWGMDTRHHVVAKWPLWFLRLFEDSGDSMNPKDHKLEQKWRSRGPSGRCGTQSRLAPWDLVDRCHPTWCRWELPQEVQVTWPLMSKLRRQQRSPWERSCSPWAKVSGSCCLSKLPTGSRRWLESLPPTAPGTCVGPCSKSFCFPPPQPHMFHAVAVALDETSDTHRLRINPSLSPRP